MTVSLWMLAFCFLLHLIYAAIPMPAFGDDAFVHLSWIEDFVRLRAQGIDIPHWSPYTWGGLGSPVLYFYPPLSYLIADVFYSAGLTTSPTGLFHIVQAITLLLSALTCWIYLRYRGLDDRLSWIGALLYSVAGYRYVDVFTRSALGEHAAFAWIPLVFLGIDIAFSAAISLQRLKAIVASTMGWGLLLLTNIPATALTAFLAGAYALTLYRRELLKAWPVAIGGLLAIVMCGFFLLPLFHFKEFIQTEKLWNFDVFGSAWHHFLIEIFEPGTRKSSIQVSAVLSWVIGLPLIYLLAQAKEIALRWRWSMLSIALLSVFLQIPYLSDLIWDRFAALQLLQFSWRFTMGLVLFTAIAVPLLLQRGVKHARYLLLGSAVISLFFYVRFALVMLQFPDAPNVLEPVRRGAPEYVNKYVAMPKDTIRTFAISMMEQPVILTAGIKSGILIDKPDTLVGWFESDRNFDLNIKRYWWPAWKMQLTYQSVSGEIRSGVPTRVQADSNGLIVLKDVAAGRGSFRLYLEKNEAESSGELISLIGVAIFGVICCWGLAIERKERSPST